MVGAMPTQMTLGNNYMEQEFAVSVVILWIILNIHKVICYYPYFKIIHYPASITINSWSILPCLSNDTTSWIMVRQKTMSQDSLEKQNQY